MKKISEIAKELGVSRQAIYKRVNSTLKQQLTPFVYKDKTGTTLIKPEGVAILRNSFLSTNCQQFNQPGVNSLQSDLIEIMREQLAIKDKQISDLSRQVEIMQHLFKTEQEKGKLLIEAIPPKGFKKWFKKIRS